MFERIREFFGRNGHAPTFQEQVATLESKLARKYVESLIDLDNYVDPRDAYYDDDGVRWHALGAGQEHERRATTLSESELDEARSQCRKLAQENEFAINGHENRISYLVGSGHNYQIVPKQGEDVPEEGLALVQAALDELLKANRWNCRQQEGVRRLDRDGEVFLRYFAPPDGPLTVRFVEPGQVYRPQKEAANELASFGIVTGANDVETVEAYFVDEQRVGPEEIQHRKANVDSNVKRGVPLFYPVRKNLRRAEKLLRNMSSVAEIQSAIALIRKHNAGTPGSIQTFVAGKAEYTVQNPVSGTDERFQRFRPGQILDARGIDYEFPASGINAGNFVTVLQAELRAIASRLVMPEFMLTSDASNANFASTMVAEGPAVRMFERTQYTIIEWDRECLMRGLTHAAEVLNQFPVELLDLIEIQAEPPSVHVRNRLEEAQESQILLASRIQSPQTWTAKVGLDYDQEQDNFERHEERTGLGGGLMPSPLGPDEDEPDAEDAEDDGGEPPDAEPS